MTSKVLSRQDFFEKITNIQLKGISFLHHLNMLKQFLAESEDPNLEIRYIEKCQDILSEMRTLLKRVRHEAVCNGPFFEEDKPIKKKLWPWWYQGIGIERRRALAKYEKEEEKDEV